MPDHIETAKGLTSAPHDAAIRATFLGQAHIAGTGPAGKTCRECVFWHPAKKTHFSFGHEEHPGELRRARCVFPILNKAKRTIPHHALACLKFEQADAPLPAKLDPPPKPTRSQRK